MMNEEKIIEIKEKFNTILIDVKEKINKDIVANPKFDELFLNELNYLYFKTNDLNFDIDIALDKNYVSIVSSAPVINCSLSELDGKNKSYFKTTFYLKDKNLYVEYNQGTLIDKKELEKSGLKSTRQYDSKIEVNYSLRCFTEYGVEYSNNSYTDCYLLDTAYEATNLKEVVLSSFHKPTFSEYKLAKAPIHVLNANVRNTYRKSGEYGVIHNNHATCTKKGYENVNCFLYSVHPLFPELLRGESKIAKTVEKDGKYLYVVENSYANNVVDGLDKANKVFKETLEKDKDKINEMIYKNLIENLK